MAETKVQKWHKIRTIAIVAIVLIIVALAGTSRLLNVREADPDAESPPPLSRIGCRTWYPEPQIIFCGSICQRFSIVYAASPCPLRVPEPSDPPRAPQIVYEHAHPRHVHSFDVIMDAYIHYGLGHLHW